MRIGAILFGILVLFGISTIFGSWYKVDEGERAVTLRNGAITGTAGPGLHFKLPFIDGVEKISVLNNVRVYEQVAAYSRDQQTATFDISVNYKLLPDQVEEIYKTYGSEEGVVTRLIERRVFEQSKTVFGQFNAASAIQDRGRLNLEVENAIREAVSGPVLIESIQIENIDFSDAYENSIEKRMLAEVAVEEAQQNLRREQVEAEIVVTKAQAEADSNLAKAKAHAEGVQIRGEAEAKAIEAKGKALRDNPDVIRFTQVEQWNGALPTTMIPNSTVPFIDMGR